MEYQPGKEGYQDLDHAEDSTKKLKISNLFYGGCFILVAILCFIVINIKQNTWLKKITRIEGNDMHEVGCSFVTRACFGMLLWFVAHALVMIGNKNLEDSLQFQIHSKLIVVHAVVLLGSIVGCMWLPEKFVQVFFKIAIVISLLFILFQLLSLLDLFDKVNEYFATEEKFAIPIAILFLLLGGAITLYALCFAYFTSTTSIAIASVNFILCFILVLASFKQENQSGLTASFVSIYVAFLTFTSLNNEKDGNKLDTYASGIAIEVISAVLTLVWLGYSSFSLGGQLNVVSCEDKTEEEFSLSYFHSIFAMCSCYLIMIVSNWGEPPESQLWIQGSGKIAMWSVISAAWASILLYMWGFIAPYACPEREFD